MCREALALASKGASGGKVTRANMVDTADSTADNPSSSSNGAERGNAMMTTLQNLPAQDPAPGQANQKAPPSRSPFAAAREDRQLDTIFQATTSATGGNVQPPPENHSVVDVSTLQQRLYAAEAESARHVQIISSMHTWAAQTTSSLRQVQEKCETVENRAKTAEKEVECLKHQLLQVAAQVEAMSVAVATANLHAHASHGAGDNNPNGKRRRKKDLPRVGTFGSLAAADNNNANGTGTGTDTSK